MFSWFVELCLKESKWNWVCRDAGGKLVCRSKRTFNTQHDAKRDFERQFEDHFAVMRCRFVV